MAWIESNQELADHPKTRKLARLLDASIPAVVGHLHCLWWWALDYADDGDLSRFDDMDIAVGARWEGDEPSFLRALISSGFLDPDYCIHDWEQYTGKLVSRRRANAARMRESRGSEKPERAEEVESRALHVQRTKRPRAEPHNTTQPDQPDQPDRSSSESARETRIAPEQPPPTRLRSVPKPKPTPVPDHWEVDADRLAFAAKHGLSPPEVERETEKFLDHFRANGKRMVDWAAAWRNWIARSSEFAQKHTPANGQASPDRLSQMDRARLSHERAAAEVAAAKARKAANGES